jgi:OOP family OmpA-OmpF porin
VLRRCGQRFGIPKDVRMSVNDGVLKLAGSVPYEWLDRVRREATLVAGVKSLDDREVRAVYDQNLAQERFEKQLGLPETANAFVTNGVLTLTGEASHRWLTRVRSEAVKLPGIASLDDHGITDLDERAFAQSKSIIENAFVYFLINKDNIATEGFAALSRLPDELRRCETAAKRIGLEIALEIRGYADAVGSETKNIDLSQRRAQKVSEFLLSCGFDSTMLRPMGIGAPPKMAPGEKPLADEAERRVALKIVSNPSGAAP